MRTCNVWHNMLSRICWRNGRRFKHSVNTLIFPHMPEMWGTHKPLPVLYPASLRYLAKVRGSCSRCHSVPEQLSLFVYTWWLWGNRPLTKDNFIWHVHHVQESLYLFLFSSLMRSTTTANSFTQFSWEAEHREPDHCFHVCLFIVYLPFMHVYF